MGRRGIDLSDHVPAGLSAERIQQADCVFAMTRSHVDAIVNMVPSVLDRVVLLLDDEDVRDPMGGTEKDYERCAQTIERGVRARLQEVDL